jgi:hypothetical protein
MPYLVAEEPIEAPINALLRELTEVEIARVVAQREYDNAALSEQLASRLGTTVLETLWITQAAFSSKESRV